MAIVCFFGPPRCGKSTILCKIARTVRASGRPVYTSGIDVSDVPSFDLADLDDGKYPCPGSLLLIDESGLSLNNQMTLSDRQREFFKLHGHVADLSGREMDIFYFSQSFDDTNIVLRRLTVEYFQIRKFWRISVAGPCGCKYVSKPFKPDAGLLDPDRGYGELMLGLRTGSSLSFRSIWCWRPHWYPFFDSHSLPDYIHPLDYPLL